MIVQQPVWRVVGIDQDGIRRAGNVIYDDEAQAESARSIQAETGIFSEVWLSRGIVAWEEGERS